MVRHAQQQLEQDVRTGWDKHERAVTALVSVDREIELARESLRLSELGFEVGTATWIDVENARVSLAGAELAQVTERMNRDLAAIELLLATGEL